MGDPLAREVFGLLFETSSEAVFIVDRETGRIVSANARASEMLSRELGALLGVTLDAIEHEDRDLRSPGHYEDVALRGSDDYPVYVELHVVHVEACGRALAAYSARDTSERRNLQRELVAKHSALYTAHADLERAHAQLSATKAELEARTQEIALIAWRGAMGELVAGVAHHLNNPVGALASTARRLGAATAAVPEAQRGELERLVAKIHAITRRIESNVAAIVQASRTTAGSRPELPPELASVLSTFAEQLDDIPTKDQP